MSDAAAVSLGGWFLAAPSCRSVETLEGILQGDPPLALWVALKADHVDASPPRSLGDLAALLAVHGLSWLQWDAESASAVSRAAVTEQIVALVAAAVVVSQLAAEAARSHGQEASRQARLLGLLRDSPQWLAALREADSEFGEIRLPPWLATSSFDQPVVEAVEQAAGSLGSVGWVVGDDWESRTQSHPHPCLRRGLEAASRWTATHEAARWLVPLMARLARLSVLERSFQESVEAEKIAAMAEFAAGAGHEINNPLAVIAGRAQLLLRDETSAERRRDLALINAQAMRVHAMIGDLRLFASPPAMERQVIDLTGLVGKVVNDLQPLAAGQETAMDFVAGISAVAVEADPVQLTVAIRALCQNAMEAVGHGHHGCIEIAVASDGRDASIRIADDGPGISPEQRPHIFEPFYSARQAGRGVGMGLSKCWRIVAQHQGRIEVASRVGQGAVFTIRIPLSRGAGE